jgi:glycosyltransferase involved in cell wall biosynthesis
MIPSSSIQVIIPALDEEATIAAVIRGLQGVGLNRIRVVDNGSRDLTVARAQGGARRGAGGG